MAPKINTVAALKRLPVGTRLLLVRSLMGPEAVPKPREIVEVRSKDLVMLTEKGSRSWLHLGAGTKVEPRDNGFAVLEPGGEVGAEYRFAEEPDAP